MLFGRKLPVAQFPADLPPLLVVVVDAEAEFQWGGSFPRYTAAVNGMAHQQRAQRIFERYGVRPTFVMDYPVATLPDGFGPVRDLYEDGLCEIGAHLHPWNNPPFAEDINDYNSFAGNLPPQLEWQKLARLTRAIEASFGTAPRIYKAGRYGLGPCTAAALRELGYVIDLSVLPYTDLSEQRGPDFSEVGNRPFWFSDRQLGIPMTVGFAGLLARRGPRIYRRVAAPLPRRLRLPGVLARARLLERITLTPEGISFAEQRRLTQALLAAGQRVFSFTYHSPSLLPGNTPYVRDRGELKAFLANIERFLDYFLGKLGGRPVTPIEVRDIALRQRTGACEPVPGE